MKRKAFEKGALVVIIRTDHKEQEWAIGRILILTHRRKTGAWAFEGERLVAPDGINSVVGVYEHEMKRIDDKDPDAVDETLLWKPVPSDEVIAA